jgi:ElaB/YqjD/DUF883 family membrane-anchored ribosome-binding protein
VEVLTAIAAATTAYKGVVRLVNAGRELEDVAGQLGKWYTAASDIANANEQAKNPPLYKKLLYRGSVEEEALNATIAKQKLAEQEKELRTMIMYRYGTPVYQEMIQLRRDIRKKREKEVYKRQRFWQNIWEGLAIAVLVGLCIGALIGLTYLISNHRA